MSIGLAMHHPVNSSQRHRTPSKPDILLKEEDFERLSRLAGAAMATMPDVARYLEVEIERATIIPQGQPSHHVVAMGSRAVYRDETTQIVHDVTLVYPHDADIAQGRVSVLTPVGAALIGLTPGQTIEWTTRLGEVRRLTLLVGADLPSG
jgi:regulator of nucleoside diphosphate kinase